MLKQLDPSRAIPHFAVLADLAHWLQGAGGTVGFPNFTEPATELEQLAKQQQLSEIESTLHELHSLASRVTAPESTATIECST